MATKDKKMKPTVYNIMGWLANHKETYKEFIKYFKELEDVTSDDIRNWVKGKEDLVKEYNDFFEDELKEESKSVEEGIGIDDYVTVAKQNELVRKNYSAEYARKKLMAEFTDKAKEFPYWVVKTSKWWDPEGLDIPNDKFTIWYGGSEQECKSWLKNKYQKSLDDKEYCDVEKYEEGKYLTVYYPHAIARATFTVMKNNETLDKPTESCNNKLKEENTNMDLWSKLEPLYNEGKVYFDVTSDNFLIIEDWKSLIEIEKALKPDFEPKDEYDTSVLDEMEIEYGFSDEWARCDHCGNKIRTAPDSYSWKADFFADYDNGELFCGDCVRENPESYIRWLLESPTERANTVLSNKELEDAGFEKVDGDYEAGWYDRNDDPEEILNKAMEDNPYREYIFSISAQGQFATNFELWARGE